MRHCEEMEGLIAASLYESLNPVEQRALEVHLADCASCRAERSALQTLVGVMPDASPVFQGNLLPAIREELRRSQPSRWSFAWRRYALGFAAAALLSSAVLLTRGGQVHAPTGEIADPVALDPVLAESRSLLARENPTGALVILQEAVATEPGTPRAGQLQLEVAELEYSVFRRYEAAYEAYRVVRENYAEAWTQSPGLVKERFDLLTEAREVNFEPLDQIDRAVAQGEGGLPALEQIMARYPGRELAQAAMETMVAMSEGEGLGALEEVRARCTNPVAVAQLDVRLGEGYCVDNVDPTKGRALLHAVAESPYEVPARMAKDVLARLEPGE